MSANNAVFVIPIEWTFPSVIAGGKVEKWSTQEKFLVFHGDMDQVGELTSTGSVTKELLWHGFCCRALMMDRRENAMLIASHLMAQLEYVEYGVQLMPVLKYEEAWG